MVAEHEQYERGRVRSASGGSEMVTTRLAMTLAVLLASGSAAAQDIRDVDLCALPLDRPMRAVHAGGNWGNNRQTVEAWEREVSEPLVPPDYVAFLQDLRVNWVGLSVALHYEDSMDSTVERRKSGSRPSRIALRQYSGRKEQAPDLLGSRLAAFESSRRHGPRGQLDVYGPSPWRSRASQRASACTLSADSLFRSRSGGDFWVNGDELRTLVESVRAEYDGLLTYTMLYLTTIAARGKTDSAWPRRGRT